MGECHVHTAEHDLQVNEIDSWIIHESIDIDRSISNKQETDGVIQSFHLRLSLSLDSTLLIFEKERKT